MASSSGGCSAADEAQMAKLGSGNADGTFPKYLAVCGKQSYLALEHRRSLNPDPKPYPVLSYLWLLVLLISTVSFLLPYL